ncbi:MAG TPA: hypothetical protein VNA20_16960 [Frankiaceae bacterium]|nr:hypothetical protein [Frankiaceae bacterium]
MRKIMALLAFAGALTAFAPPAHAAPAASGPSCGFVTGTANRGIGGDSLYAGAVWGGPVVLRDNAVPTVLYAGSLTCTVRVTGSFGCSVTSPLPTTGTTAAAGLCNYLASESDVIQICSRIDIVGGGTLYYTDGVGWTSSQGSCPFATTQTCDTEAGLPCGVKRDFVDPVVCPLLVPFFPPDGDVGIFYDCPPYSYPPAFSGYVVLHWAVPEVGV